MYSITVTGHLDSAHYLREYQGKCANPHGHRFSYQITLVGPELDNLGMIVDFGDIKAIMKSTIEDYLDHKMLNDLYPFDKVNPTAENIAHWIYDEVYNTLHEGHVVSESYKLTKVRVYESPDASSEYWE